MELRPYLDHRAVIYEALQHAVSEGYTKLSDFADEVGKSSTDVSLRLRRAEDGKGYPQTSPLDFLATIAMRPVAREVFLRDLAAAWGYRIEPARPATLEERIKALRGAVSDTTARQIERATGLPAGSLG